MIRENQSNAWFSILLSEEESGKAFSSKYIVENIGAMVGPVLGTFFVTYDVKVPFAIAAGCMLLTAILFFLCSRGMQMPQGTRINGGDAPIMNGVRQTFLMVFRDKRLLYFTVGGILSMMVYGALATFMSLFFSSILSYDVAYHRVAYVSALNAVIVMAAQYVVSASVKKNTIMKWIRLGILSMIAGLVILIFHSDILCLTAAVVLLSLDEVTIVPAEYLFIIKITPEELRGVYIGAQNLIYLGLSLSPVICGFLLDNTGPQMMFLCLACILVGSLLFYQSGYQKSEGQ